PQSRLYYDIKIERDDVERGHEGASMHLPSRPPQPTATEVDAGADAPPGHPTASPARAVRASDAPPRSPEHATTGFSEGAAHPIRSEERRVGKERRVPRSTARQEKAG